MRRLIYLPVALLAYWAIAQTAPQPLAGIFPAGALLYLEAKDFAGLLADWNGSAEKTAWLQSANHDAFSRSRLFLKLGQAQTEFATAAGVPPDYAMLSAVAGGNSALAMYHIGNLEFLYATHLASARAVDTALWKARGSYQTRRAGGVDYFVKEDKGSHRVAAFAYAGDVLLLATKEDLIAGALELLARQARPAVASEKWFQDTVQAAQPGSNDLRLVYNLERLLATPHFRSYWVQRNNSVLREFSSGLADLERVRGEVQERRVMLRMNPAAAVSDEASTAQLLAMVPDDAGFYRAQVGPGVDRVVRWIEEKLLGAAVAPAPESKTAPVVTASGEAGSEQDLETRIDTAPFNDDRDRLGSRKLREYLASKKLDAMLEVSGAVVDPDQVFIGTRSALVLVSDSWDVTALNLEDRTGKLAVAANGRWLVAGDSKEFVDAIFARRNRPPVSGAAYVAGWRHSRELPNYERMLRLIDFPQIPPQGEQADAREPMFFSENLASLGRALRRVQSAEVAVHDSGAMLRETVVYRIAP
ncbi:MAG TPA: hypothetical protein VNX18_12595 [Bryobacteraceae bacterium]|nr:hypothetical protein [Bryobacteraceae bacterium]